MNRLIGGGGTVCAVRSCTSSSVRKNIILHRFPKETERCKLWLIACNREDLLGKQSIQLHNNYRLCGLHFEDRMYTNITFKNRLLPTAVPTIFPHLEGRSLNNQKLVNANTKFPEVPSKKINIPSGGSTKNRLLLTAVPIIFLRLEAGSSSKRKLVTSDVQFPEVPSKKINIFSVENLNILKVEDTTKGTRWSEDVQLFNCQKTTLEKYYCKDCKFFSDLMIILHRHVVTYHQKHQNQRLVYTVQTYICRNCSFETHSLLQWYKHNQGKCLKILSKKWLLCD